MSLDTALILLNMFLAGRAVWFNMLEACEGFSEWRVLRWTVTGFAAVYFLAYAVLLSGLVGRLEWSHAMIGVSPAVWEMVWTQPAKRSRNVRLRVVSEGKALVDAGSR